MENFGQFIGGCLTTLLIFLLTIIGSTLIGALVGWVVGWFFGQIILDFFAAIGIEGFTMAQLGAVLGFVGSFFKTNVTNNYLTPDNRPF